MNKQIKSTLVHHAKCVIYVTTRHRPHHLSLPNPLDYLKATIYRCCWAVIRGGGSGMSYESPLSCKGSTSSAK